MCNPLDFLTKYDADSDDVQLALREAVSAIGGIADVLYSVDLSEVDHSTPSGLGAALLIINGAIELSIEKLTEISTPNIQEDNYESTSTK